MNYSQISNQKIARVTDILEQIEELNKMIELNKDDSKDNSMLSQYQFMRNEFVEKLKYILNDFHIKIQAA